MRNLKNPMMKLDVFDLLDKAESTIRSYAGKYKTKFETAQSLVIQAKKIEEIAGQEGLSELQLVLIN
jgi:hypothetical protein